MRTVLLVSFAAALLLSGGCGSLSSHWNGRHGPYVGTKFDVEQVKRYTQEQEVGEGEVVAGLDIPLSFIIDTLMLPYDLSVKKKGESSNQQAATSEPSTSAPPKAESEAPPLSEQQRPASPVVTPPPTAPPAQNLSPDQDAATREALRKAVQQDTKGTSTNTSPNTYPIK